MRKHEALGNIVKTDSGKCQLFYEVQGNVYLHSDVKAGISDVSVVQESKERVHVSIVRRYPSPDTRKVAVLYSYRAGYQCEMLPNVTIPKRPSSRAN